MWTKLQHNEYIWKAQSILIVSVREEYYLLEWKAWPEVVHYSKII